MQRLFKTPHPIEAANLMHYFFLRPCKACESGWLDFFLWADFYQVRYRVADEKALLMIMKEDDEYFAALPYCKEEDLQHYFDELLKFFNYVLERPFKIYLADEEGVMALGLCDNEDFVVREEENFKDYLYDAEALRTLAGRKLQKKRNLINNFCKNYGDRWEYRTLGCENKADIRGFLDEWFPKETENDPDGVRTLEFERRGLNAILTDCAELDVRIGGIFIDGTLKAFSMGTYNPREEMAVISVEKADPEIPGLYQLINREFLVHEFPEAKLVNREDDVGLPGLRKAKLSYHPCGFEKKYMIAQKCFRGEEVDLTDPYEEEVKGYSEGDNETSQ